MPARTCMWCRSTASRRRSSRAPRRGRSPSAKGRSRRSRSLERGSPNWAPSPHRWAPCLLPVAPDVRPSSGDAHPPRPRVVSGARFDNGRQTWRPLKTESFAQGRAAAGSVRDSTAVNRRLRLRRGQRGAHGDLPGARHDPRRPCGARSCTAGTPRPSSMRRSSVRSTRHTDSSSVPTRPRQRRSGRTPRGRSAAGAGRRRELQCPAAGQTGRSVRLERRLPHGGLA